MVAVEAGQAAFGQLLQEWRRFRKLTQLGLALDTRISTRHLSFLESGRARPSREMVLRLAATLGLPFRERNQLLVAAGFAPVFGELAIEASQMTQVRKALDLILAKQEPFPAVVMDRYWNLLMSNRGAAALFGRMIDLDALESPVNLLRLMFDRDGLKPFVMNWDEVAGSLIDRLHREANGGILDARSRELLVELRSLGAPPETPLRPSPDDAPFLPVEFEVAGERLSFFSAVTTLGAPHEVTAQELRIECFFPANAASEELAQRWSDEQR
jgi:transcriptional regulator with XRE-family HTH domain